MAVPTPVDKDNTPDLRPLENACISIGHALRVRASSSKPLIVFESTVYPGCTEDYCVPIIENESGLTSSKDFTVGYSPERVNPGDTEHTLSSVIKIVSGQDNITCERLANLYSHVAKSGVHKASSIKTAEAAKVIENIQRDLNIALMNELAFLFNELGVETSSVLEAASTKWNFMKMTPGLVGGHCIGVDPYYLTHKALEVGYNPEMILAGRRINDNMSFFIGDDGKKYSIFGEGGVKKTADEFQKEFLGEIPINPEVGKQGDMGVPIVESKPDHEISKIYLEFAQKIKSTYL